jgi:YD repeat-containing protein
MTNLTTTILLLLLTLAMMTGAAMAEQRTFFDAGGNVVGRSATDSQGTTTNYDAKGKVVSRESTSGNTTTVYDDRRPKVSSDGRVQGLFCSSPNGFGDCVAACAAQYKSIDPARACAAICQKQFHC